MEELFQGNSTVIERELYFSTLIHNLLRHSAYLLFEEASEK